MTLTERYTSDPRTTDPGDVPETLPVEWSGLDADTQNFIATKFHNSDDCLCAVLEMAGGDQGAVVKAWNRFRDAEMERINS